MKEKTPFESVQDPLGQDDFKCLAAFQADGQAPLFIDWKWYYSLKTDLYPAFRTKAKEKAPASRGFGKIGNQRHLAHIDTTLEFKLGQDKHRVDERGLAIEGADLGGKAGAVARRNHGTGLIRTVDNGDS